MFILTRPAERGDTHTCTNRSRRDTGMSMYNVLEAHEGSDSDDVQRGFEASDEGGEDWTQIVRSRRNTNPKEVLRNF